MKCTRCGREVSPNQDFCSNCGAKVEKTNVVYGESNKKGGIPVWVFIVVILSVIIVMSVIMVLLLFSNKYKKQSKVKNDVVVENVDNTTNSVGIQNTTNTASNSGSIVSNNSKSNYTVIVGNYKMKVPDNIIYQKYKDNNEDSLVIGDEKETWRADLNIFEGSIATATPEKIASNLRTSGITVGKYESKTINGLQCYTFEASKSGQNMLIMYARVNSMTFVGAAILYKDYTTYYYNAAEIVATIASTVEQVSSSTNNNLEINDENIFKLDEYIKE